MRKHFALFVLLSSFFGCSAMKSSKATPEMHITVVRVAFEYLDSVIQANPAAVDSRVFWDEYLHNKGNISKEEYDHQLALLRDTSTPASHPLVNLDLADVSTRGNTATVKVRKYGRPDAPLISVDLLWSGEAWLVVDDSIFGRDGIIAKRSSSKDQA